MTQAVQPIRPAATVILIREAPVSFEIFMLKRTSRASFASGMTKEGPSIKKSTGAKASGITKISMARSEKYKNKIQNVMQNLDDSLDTDEDERSSKSD